MSKIEANWTEADMAQAEAMADEKRAKLAAVGITLHPDGTMTREVREPLPAPPGRRRRPLPKGLSWTGVTFRRGGKR